MAVQKSTIARTGSKKKMTLKWWYVLPVIAVVAIAGYAIVTFSEASSLPRNLTQLKVYNRITARDGVVSRLECKSVTGSYLGTLSHCLQQHPNNLEMFRPGYFDITTKIFWPSQVWLPRAHVGWKSACTNIKNRFDGSITLTTGYGAMSYGQIYRYNNGKWQIRWAFQSLADGKCHISHPNSWVDAKPL